MELFRLEHKKLWKKKSVKISFLLCFSYIVIFGSFLNYQFFIFGSYTNENTFHRTWNGNLIIEQSKAHTEPWNGPFTDETLREMVADYQKLEATDYSKTALTEWSMVNDWLQSLWPELKDFDAQFPSLMISYVDPEKLSGFYDRRQQVVEDFLKNNSQTGKEGEYLLQMNQEISQPFHYTWVQGWAVLLGDMLPDFGMVIALFLAIVLSTIFAGEWHNRTSPLILTTKKGWRSLAGAKIGVGIAFTLELCAALIAGGACAQLLFLGTDGWDLPIQFVKLIAIAPMNMLQAEIYEYVCIFLGALGFAGVVLLISSRFKSTFLSLLFSLGIVYLPMILGEYLPYEWKKLLDLMPLSGSSADIFRTYTFSFFGHFLWSPWLLLTVPFLLGCICLPFAVKGWCRRMKA